MSPIAKVEAGIMAVYIAEQNIPVMSGEAHCRRVAGLACEVGRRIGLSLGLIETLSRAATLHEDPKHLNRGCQFPGVGEVLEAFQGPTQQKPNGTATILADILHLANSFDENFEWRMFDTGPGSEIAQELSTLASLGIWSEPVFQAFQSISFGARNKAIAKAEDLPVSTVYRIQKLTGSSPEQLDVDGLERLALEDTVVSMDLLRHANSAAYSKLEPIRSVRQAITQIGTVVSREVMLASAARGIFASSSLRHLWQHSLRCANAMRGVAARVGLDENRAFLLGLLHDIGRISLECLDSESRGVHAQLCKTEAPAIWIEVAIAGCDHAELGAQILARWNLPVSIIESVRNHHSPERSGNQLTSLLYLVECTENANEDIFSPLQFSAALSTVKMSKAQFENALVNGTVEIAC